jgi:hypothetical protein
MVVFLDGVRSAYSIDFMTHSFDAPARAALITGFLDPYSRMSRGSPVADPAAMLRVGALDDAGQNPNGTLDASWTGSGFQSGALVHQDSAEASNLKQTLPVVALAVLGAKQGRPIYGMEFKISHDKRSRCPRPDVRNWQCALKARIISGGGFHPDNCR